MRKPQLRGSVTCSVNINAAGDDILPAFFTHEALTRWWHITRSLCVPRPLGCYAVEWAPSERRDEVLGRLGGVFHGTVMSYDAGREFFVAEAFWMAPDGDPIGPMAFEVRCSPGDGGSMVSVRVSSADTSERWHRYYEAMNEGLTVSLERLKTMIEARST